MCCRILFFIYFFYSFSGNQFLSYIELSYVPFGEELVIYRIIAALNKLMYLLYGDSAAISPTHPSKLVPHQRRTLAFCRAIW